MEFPVDAVWRIDLPGVIPFNLGKYLLIEHAKRSFFVFTFVITFTCFSKLISSPGSFTQQWSNENNHGFLWTDRVDYFCHFDNFVWIFLLDPCPQTKKTC